MAGVAMPAAAKIMADNSMAAGSVAGSGKDGRVTKGDVLGAINSGANNAPATVTSAPNTTNIPTGAPKTVLAQVAAPAVDTGQGDRPDQLRLIPGHPRATTACDHDMALRRPRKLGHKRAEQYERTAIALPECAEHGVGRVSIAQAVCTHPAYRVKEQAGRALHRGGVGKDLGQGAAGLGHGESFSDRESPC